MGAPKAHTVLLNFDFNAAITHCPRLGIFGWAKRVQLEGKLLVLVFTRRSKWKKTLQKVSGAEIYGGGKRPHAPA